jgi:hypothetical protein
MAYKYSTGSVRRGDIYFEDDRTGPQTYIDFGQDTITLRPSGSAILYAAATKIGIGTQVPTQDLHVSGSGDTTLRVQGPPGHYGALNVKGGSGESAWVWQPANTSELRLFTVDDDRMTILGTGEIGVGTNTPKNALDIHHDPTGLADNTGGGEVVTFGGEDGVDTLAAGKLMYLHSGGDWKYADADAAATSGPVLLGIALGTTIGEGILLRGFFDVATIQGTFSKGAACYVSENAGDIDFTAPSATGDVVRVIGWATDVANVIYFNPSGDWVEIA